MENKNKLSVIETICYIALSILMLSTGFNSLCINSQPQIGYKYIYLQPVLSAVFVLSFVVFFVAFVIAFKEFKTKQKIGYILICILSISMCWSAVCIGMDCIKDIKNGTVMESTEFYNVMKYTRKRAKIIIYDKGGDKMLYLTEKQFDFIINNTSEPDKNDKVKISDHIYCPRHDKLDIEYYPENLFVKNITIGDLSYNKSD